MLPVRQEVVVALEVDARFLSHSDRVARGARHTVQITHALLPVRAKRGSAILALEVAGILSPSSLPDDKQIERAPARDDT